MRNVAIPLAIADMEQIYEVLKRYFGYDSFRPMQEEVIRHILGRKDALVLMPTGGGKSLCFQIPALMMEGTAVVISPLISLMKDQVDMLRSNGIEAAALNSSLDSRGHMEVRSQCRNGRLKLLYLSPERLQADLEWIRTHMKVSLFVVDEAHCISAWGHDFRPEYTQLGNLHELFPGVPVAAFTATADKVTREDIVVQLHMQEARLFVGSFDRPNLSLSVVAGCSAKDKQKMILDIIHRHDGESGIIYCMTRKTTEELSSALKLKGVPCACYHAGMDAEQRRMVQNDFRCDRIQVVCATVAFGMGIDKQDVRFVVHYNLPGSIENYYQEIGRGGRDGMPCETVLFYNLQDLVMRRRFAEESAQQELNRQKLGQMQDYAEANVCRRRILLNYFGERSETDCRNCDVCENPPARFDGSELVQKMLSVLVRTGESVGSTAAIDILTRVSSQLIKRKGFDKIKTFGAGAEISREDWKSYLMQMIHLGYVEVDVLHFRRLKVTTLGEDVLYGRKKAELSVIDRRDFKVPRKKPTMEIPYDDEDRSLFEALRALRLTLAREEKMPAYIILSDKCLHSLASRRPSTLAEFGECYGIGEAKTQKYGAKFLEIIAAAGVDTSDTCGAAETSAPKPESYMERQKILHENAYARWTEEDDTKLLSLFSKGVSIAELSSLFSRNEGSIRSRLKKLEVRTDDTKAKNVTGYWDEINDRRIEEKTQEVLSYCAQKKGDMTIRSFELARLSLEHLLDNIMERDYTHAGIPKMVKDSMIYKEDVVAECNLNQAASLARSIVYKAIGDDLNLYPVTAEKKLSRSKQRGEELCNIPANEMTARDYLFVAKSLSDGEAFTRGTALNVFFFFNDYGFDPMMTRVFASYAFFRGPKPLSALPLQSVLGTDYRKPAEKLVSMGVMRKASDKDYELAEDALTILKTIASQRNLPEIP